MKKHFLIIFILELVFWDQFLKFLIRRFLETPIEVTSFFQIVFVENEGIAFSLPVPPIFLIPFIFLVLFFLGRILCEKTLTKLETWAGILIFSGAAGNLIDRIIYGKVTDFLSFWEFPVFNLADSFISVGVGVFVLSEVSKNLKFKNQNSKLN